MLNSSLSLLLLAPFNQIIIIISLFYLTFSFYLQYFQQKNFNKKLLSFPLKDHLFVDIVTELPCCALEFKSMQVKILGFNTYSIFVSFISRNMVLLFKATHDCIVEALLAIILKFWIYFYFADQSRKFPLPPQ